MNEVEQYYSWLLKIDVLPKMIAEGLKLVGLKEIPGMEKDNPIIMGMAKDLHLPAEIYPHDETAWCALVHNWICLRTDKPLSGTDYQLIRAKEFEHWGIYSSIPMLGDTCVFNRKGGFHVGFYIAEDITHYHIMGGNQNNSYGIMRLEKKRLHTSRRYYKTGPPASVRQYIVSPAGVLSNNEA